MNSVESEARRVTTLISNQRDQPKIKVFVFSYIPSNFQTNLDIRSLLPTKTSSTFLQIHTK